MKKRLKIAEQILIVLLLALILPLIIASAIIINTNQIAVRKELTVSATIIANSLENELLILNKQEENNIYYLREALLKIPSENSRQDLIKLIKKNNREIKDISINKLPKNIIVKNKFSTVYMPEKKEILFSLVDMNNVLTSKTVSLEYITKAILNDFNDQDREVYILDRNKNLLLSKNHNENTFDYIINNFPDEIKPSEPVVFSEHKNQPNVLLYLEDFDWYIIVYSPEFLTSYGIIEARKKIILSICIAAVMVLILFGLYTFSLYTNIRQFFKTIQAISAGNYKKKLRFLIQPLTSQEIIFIADEFNKMLNKIHKSHSELNASNKKLMQMDSYKSNLIDTVSHEFRTPLTSIKGYASSLLRHGDNIDENARKKSLKIIKAQAERLSRMVEDLLVIPDIESATLRMNFAETNIKNIIETSISYTSKTDNSLFDAEIPEDIPTVYSDEDRLIQIMVNLLENALKYSKENTPISIKAFCDEDFVSIKIHNEAEIIEEEKLNELFEKFTRVDSNLTRTTRGTGLGLYIVKGLVENMGGNISLSSNDGFEVTFTIPVYKGQDNENA